MGVFISRLYDALSGLQEKRILMIGLDAAGKTTVLYKLHLNDCISTVPTVGFNVEKLQYKKLEMTVWDVGGQEKIRRLWRYYFNNTDALIWVIDSSDTSRLDEVREELFIVLTDSAMESCRTVLMFANKQDLPNALSCSELSQRMGLNSGLSNPLRGRTWYIQPCCARTGDGLYEGLDWLSAALKKDSYR